ncbi:MAG: ClpXP protease specificity-enhancing factor SspB [Rhodospirillaceae bacterium]|nr:ClpXP protease specificity-enhancing factor SspB [Rhodospirillaceae bacterium]
MAISSFSYERMVEDALRGVLRQALTITATQGLPGSHHFYITFDTTHPQVRIPESLRTLHPNEMTIVLQHQFWDLKVNDDGFEITLSFSGVSQRLKVPFAAVTAFADPHAKFGLQFHVEFVEKSGADEDREARARDEAKITAGTGATPDKAANSGKAKDAMSKDGPRPTVVSPAPAAPSDDENKVITLDKFRKK